MSDVRTPPPSATSWSQLPPAPAPRPAPVVVVWALTVVPLAAALLQLDVEAWRVALLAVGALVGLVLARAAARRPGAVAAVVLVSAAVAAVGIGVRAAVVAATSAVLWSLALPAFRKAAAGHPARALRPTVGPLVVADVLLLTGGRVRWAAVVLLLGVVVCVVGWRAPRAMSRVADLGDRAGHLLGTALAAVAVLPAAVVLTVMWALYRLVGFDPLRPRRDATGWRTRSSGAVRADRGTALEVDGRVGPSGRRRRGLAGALAVVLLVVAVLAALTYPARAPRSAALDDPTWPQVWAQQNKFNAHPLFDPTTVFRLRDFSSTFVNQVDGRRRTWRPPPCDCERRTVWWFGGSAAWGFFQSDDQTVPSQVARRAWKDGVALDIENYALPGYSLSQEMQLFAQLSVTQPPPDLAVFYDGANELFLQVDRNNAGRGSDESPATYADAQYQTLTRVASSPQRWWGWLTDGRAAPDAPKEPSLDAPQVADHAMARYRRQVELTRAVADRAGIPVLFVWQPTRSTSPAATAAEFEPTAPKDAAWFRRLSAAGRAGLPDGVLDLSDAFAALRSPVFPDWAHTNALGATTVGDALAPEVVVRSTPAAGR